MALVGKKTIIVTAILLFCIIAYLTVGFLIDAFADLFTPDEIKQIHYTRAKILYHTDHEKLLKICRERIAAYNKTFPDDLPEQIDPPEQTNPPAGLMPGLGAVRVGFASKRTYMRILDLTPTFVYIYRDSIYLEMCTGFSRTGLMAFPKGVEGHGDLKLLDGLWYHDGGFSHNPDFSVYLERLKQYDLEELKQFSFSQVMGEQTFLEKLFDK